MSPSTPPVPALPGRPGAVQLWVLRLDAPSPPGTAGRPVLSPCEEERAQRFVREADRRRYVAAHTAVRHILGLQLGMDPAVLRLEAGPFGKPRLGHGPPGVNLDFNLSHSHELGLLGVSWDGRIGVDIERIRADMDFPEMSRQYFAPAEREELGTKPPDRRVDTFFAIWTRKEAYLKALGTGLNRDLSRFAILESPAGLRLVDEECPDAAGQWDLAHLEVPAGFRAAVAVRSGIPIPTATLWNP